LDNELLDNKFTDIDEKVDFLIELCQTVQVENTALTAKVAHLESALNKKKEAEELYAEQQAAIRLKIDGLLTKLDNFSDTP